MCRCAAYERTADVAGNADLAGNGSIGAKNTSRSMPSLVTTPIRHTPPELPSKYMACQIAVNEVRKKTHLF